MAINLFLRIRFVLMVLAIGLAVSCSERNNKFDTDEADIRDSGEKDLGTIDSTNDESDPDSAEANDDMTDGPVDADAMECGELPVEGCPCTKGSPDCCLEIAKALSCGDEWINGIVKVLWVVF